jgi:BRCT domain type II-containing protein
MQYLKKIKTTAMITSLITATAITSSCASIVSGTHQPVSIKTTPATGATCSLENNKGKWYVTQTPGSVDVSRSYHDMHVVCEKPGYKKVEKLVSSNTKAIAFGNVIFGGVIGAGVDIADGAAYDYPTNIMVDMRRA